MNLITSNLKHALDNFIARLQKIVSQPRGIQHEFDHVQLKAFPKICSHFIANYWVAYFFFLDTIMNKLH